MKMDRRHRNDSKWYELPQRKSRKKEISNGASKLPPKVPTMIITTPSETILMNREKASGYTSSRSTSRTTFRSSSRSSQVYDLSGSFKQRRQGTLVKDIEEILNRTPATRPRSVSLVKYEPLPAINPCPSTSSSAESQESGNLNVFENEEEEELLEQLKSLKEEGAVNEDTENKIGNDNEEGLNTASANFSPPKLVRSRTFDVIETNLTNLPIIDEPSAQDEVRQEVVLTIDGIPLMDFISQTQSDVLPQHRHLESFGLDARPLSRSSLYTHPGTPDSGFGAPTIDTSSTRSHCRSSRSLAYQLPESEDSEEDSDLTLERGLYIRFPDDTLVFSNGALDESLYDFLKRIENMKYEGKKLKIRESSVPDVDLHKKIKHYGITEHVSIHLVNNM